MLKWNVLKKYFLKFKKNEYSLKNRKKSKQNKKMTKMISPTMNWFLQTLKAYCEMMLDDFDDVGSS